MSSATGLPAARVVESHPESALYRLVRLARTDAVATAQLLAAHTAVGQFVELEAGGDRTLFALADTPRPDAGWVELLVKPGGSVADALMAARPGDVVGMSDPAGAGYAVDHVLGCDLVLVAAGSGIAPIRAMLLTALDRRDQFGTITLYYGQRRAEHFAFRDELAVLAVAGDPGIRIVLVASGEGADWRGPRGHVQEEVVVDAACWRPDATGIVVCGMPEMEQEIEALAAARGVPAERVLTNT